MRSQAVAPIWSLLACQQQQKQQQTENHNFPQTIKQQTLTATWIDIQTVGKEAANVIEEEDQEGPAGVQMQMQTHSLPLTPCHSLSAAAAVSMLFVRMFS